MTRFEYLQRVADVFVSSMMFKIRDIGDTVLRVEVFDYPTLHEVGRHGIAGFVETSRNKFGLSVDWRIELAPFEDPSSLYQFAKKVEAQLRATIEQCFSPRYDTSDEITHASLTLDGV